VSGIVDRLHGEGRRGADSLPEDRRFTRISIADGVPNPRVTEADDRVNRLGAALAATTAEEMASVPVISVVAAQLCARRSPWPESSPGGPEGAEPFTVSGARTSVRLTCAGPRRRGAAVVAQVRATFDVSGRVAVDGRRPPLAWPSITSSRRSMWCRRPGARRGRGEAGSK
jgi:hypothetical protein